MGVIGSYINTDVGYIPVDWQVMPIYNVASVKTGPFGSTLHEKDYVREGTPIITVEHLSEHGIIHSNLPMVSDYDLHRLIVYSLLPGDIVFSRVGSVDRNSLVSDKENGWLFSGRLLRIRVNSKLIHPPFLSYYFHSEPFKKRVRSVAVGQTMPSLNTNIIKNILIAVPPLAEQIAIACALNDIEALITNLNALIKKKRLIKQGCMLELLTGVRRLPGFSEGWKPVGINEMFKFLNSANNSRSQLLTSGTTNYIHYGDIHTKWETFLDCDNSNLPYIGENGIEGIDRLDDGDLIMADASEDYKGIGKSVEIKNIRQKKIIAGLHTLVLRGDKKILADGFKGYLQYIPSFKNSLIKVAVGISVFGISKRNIQDISIFLPDPEEQEVIAKILTDIDNEIAALEKRRVKTALIKQGMMQELLTGKTRLYNY
ncbi:MAG: restriction endonuclease subunit S [Bellilinea sp.]